MPTPYLLKRRWRRVPPLIAEALRCGGPCELLKTRPTQQLVTGWASVIADGSGRPVVDGQGDIIEEAELVRAVADYMASSRLVGHDHRANPDGSPVAAGRVVESLVLTRELKRQLGLPARTPTGWLVTMKIDDPVVWSEIISGERTALSIGGTGLREQS